jgi:hypothetical protein
MNTRRVRASSSRSHVFLGAVALALLLICAGTAYREMRRGWGRYFDCPRPGDAEVRLQTLFLGEAPVEQRYEAIFLYFAHGFASHLSADLSRVQYCGAGSVNGFAVDGLEGFARTAPLLAAWLRSGRARIVADPVNGRPIDLVNLLKRGIVRGVDRRSRAYWGDIRDNDQRIIEAADIARTLWLTKEMIWDELGESEKLMVLRWLLQASRATTPPDNWMLFPILVDLVVSKLNANSGDTILLARARSQFAAYRILYLEQGWFNDPPNGVDYYNAWGITYELFWLTQIDPTFETHFIGKAIADSSILTEHVLSPHGFPIMGRSICYRTAVPVPVLAAQLLDGPEAETGHALRALDAVWRHFIAHDGVRDGALTQGYEGPDPRFLDSYLGAGSCQWGLRSLVLAFMHGAGDRFWMEGQARLPVEVSDYQLEYPKLGWRVRGQVANAEVTIEVLHNSSDINRPDAYTTRDRILETVLRRPVRPSNHDVKYESRIYSSAQPFPLQE